MKHLGDITSIDWHTVEPVDVVTGGSPCQDLSVAGKRAGLAGERSGLYMEQIRCVKELREADVRRGRTGQFVRPRYMVWENVVGAFSSGKPKGADFAAVLEEIIKVAEPDAYVCVVQPSGGWTKSGCYYDRAGRWSIAWRVHDAQFWGVPQRRKRIALVADFGGLTAPEILFERKGMSGNFEEVGTPWETAAGDAANCAGADDREGIPYTLKVRSGCSVDSAGKAAGKGALVQTNKAATLGVTQDQYLFQPIAVATQQGGAEISKNGVCPTLTAAAGMSGNNQPWICKAYGISSYESNAMKSANPHSGVYEADTARTLDLNGGNPACNQGGIAIVEQHFMDAYQHHGYRENDVCGTLTAGQNETVRGDTPLVTVEQQAVAYGIGNGQANQSFTEELVGALNCMHDQQAVAYLASGKETVGTLCAGPGERCFYSTQELFSGDYHIIEEKQCYRQGGFGDFVEGEVGTLRAAGGDLGGGSENLVVEQKPQYIVRRLTPLECERLQGYPDGWTDIGEWTDSKGKKRKDADSPRYKALGNSIALPFWKWMLKRISAQYEREATLGSLFDGIGGFPLCWEQINGKGTARWASEIEEFPMAVTKLRFGEE